MLTGEMLILITFRCQHIPKNMKFGMHQENTWCLSLMKKWENGSRLPCTALKRVQQQNKGYFYKRLTLLSNQKKAGGLEEIIDEYNDCK